MAQFRAPNIISTNVTADSYCLGTDLFENLHIAYVTEGVLNLHTLLADRVLAPLLAEHEQDIALWRFHRRASRDTAGHQFSLIFYGDADLREAFRDRLEGDPLLTALRREGVVEAVTYSGPDPRQASIGVTSDSAWPRAIQDSWPWFIMGASRSWLDLVARVRAGRPDPGSTLAALRVEYRDIDQAVNTLWGEEGYHAYLHHLNAVFGYQPLRNDRTGQWERY